MADNSFVRMLKLADRFASMTPNRMSEFAGTMGRFGTKLKDIAYRYQPSSEPELD